MKAGVAREGELKKQVKSHCDEIELQSSVAVSPEPWIREAVAECDKDSKCWESVFAQLLHDSSLSAYESSGLTTEAESF